MCSVGLFVTLVRRTMFYLYSVDCLSRSCALFGMSFLLVSYVSVSRTVLLTISHVGALCTVLCVLFDCLVG